MSAAVPDALAGRGDWMITASGRRFYPLDPRPEDISIVDIAHQLARLCRYGGAVEGWCSVAEHSVLLAQHFVGKGERRLAQWALLHDAAEAYINDLIRPVKPAVIGFKPIEIRIESVIWPMFELYGGLPPEVKEADTAIVGDERQQLFTAQALKASAWKARPGLGVTCRQLERDDARLAFLDCYDWLFLGARRP